MRRRSTFTHLFALCAGLRAAFSTIQTHRINAEFEVVFNSQGNVVIIGNDYVWSSASPESIDSNGIRAATIGAIT